MEDLPVPLNRVEFYLAKAAGMDVTIPEKPLNRAEEFLAVIAGDTSVVMPTPLSLTEQWLAYVAGLDPLEPLAIEGAHLIGVQMVDTRYFAVAAGVPGATLPEEGPQNRAEQYWAKIKGSEPGVLKYVTGSSLYLTDVARSVIESIQLNGDTFQQTYSGKNLLPVPDSRTTTNATFTNNGDGTFNVVADGAQTSSIEFSVIVPLANSGIVGGQKYTISSNKTIGGNPGELDYFVHSVDSNGTWKKTLIGFDSAGTKTAGEPSTEYIKFIVRVRKETVINLTNVKTQIEAGESQTAWQPYTGGTPSPNPDYPQDVNVVTGEQTVTVTGKNLFDINTLAATGITVANGVATGTATAFNNAWKNGITLPSVSGQVTAKATAYTDGNASTAGTIGLRVRAYYTDNTYSDLLYWNNSETIATTRSGTSSSTKTINYIAIVWNAAVGNIWHLFNFQIEYGSTATTYEPYQSTTKTIDLGSTELCKIGTYVDGIFKNDPTKSWYNPDLEDNAWYVHKETGKVTYDGNASENWTYNSSYPRVQIGLADNMRAYASNAYCTHLTTGNTATASSDNVFNIGGTALFMKATSVATSKDAWMTWLTTHNVSLYYSLATPTDTKITDATLIGELEALEALELPKPIAYITASATSPNLPAQLKIGYYGLDE